MSSERGEREESGTEMNEEFVTANTSLNSYHSAVASMSVSVVLPAPMQGAKDQSQVNFSRFMTFKEICNGVTIIMAMFFSAVALKFPDESYHTHRIKAYILLHTTLIYFVGYILTIELDHNSDGADGLFYDVAEGGPLVFYEKTIVHLAGLVVFGVSMWSSLSSLETNAKKYVYAVTMISILLNGIYNLEKLYKSDKMMALVLLNLIDDQEIRFIVKPRSKKYPPHGRLVHYEVDPAYLPFLMN